MRLVKRSIQWIIGIICGLFLSLQIAMYMPFIQEKVGSIVSSVLKETWDWDIKIDKVRIGLGNRIIIDGIELKDKQDSTIVNASRLAAKIDLLPLLEGRVSIANAQLFGTSINLYQQTPEESPNFQFLIDTFSSNDTTSSPINLHIGSVVLRRVSINWNQQWMPHKPEGTLDPAHLQLNNIALTAHLRTLTSDSLNVAIKRLSFIEKSGFCIENISLETAYGSYGGYLHDMAIKLPHSTISLPSFEAAWPDSINKKNFKNLVNNTEWNSHLSLNIVPSDFKTLVPKLSAAHSPISIKAEADGRDGNVNIKQFKVDNNGSLSLASRIHITDITGEPYFSAAIDKLQANKKLQLYITQELEGKQREISPLITRLDTVNIKGRIEISRQKQTYNISIINHCGNIGMNAELANNNDFKLSVYTTGIDVDKILSDNGQHTIGNIAFNTKAHGVLHNKHNLPQMEINTLLPHVHINGNEYTDAHINASVTKDKVSATAHIDDIIGSAKAEIKWQKNYINHIVANIDIDNMLTERLGLGNRYPEKSLSITSNIDVRGTCLDDITGSISINDAALKSTDTTAILVGPYNLDINTSTEPDNRNLYIKSNFINASAIGDYKFTTLLATIQNHLHKELPNIISKKPLKVADNLNFSISIQDTTFLRHIILKNITIPKEATITGNIYGSDSLKLSAHIPYLQYNKEYLRNSNLSIHSSNNLLTSLFTTERRQKKGFTTLSLKANAGDNRLRLITSIDNQRQPRSKGELDITANFINTHSDDPHITAWIAPTDLTISDVPWRIYPTSLALKNKKITIKGFKVSDHNNRNVEINGQISTNKEDTLNVALENIDVKYILDLVNFHSVEFEGDASGNVHATKLLSQPYATADITVENFNFNQAPMGKLTAKANWGETPNMLKLDASIYDETNNHSTNIHGGFNIGDKSRGDGLDLRINTKRFNLAFLNFFTKSIFEDFQGRGTGYCRIYGPFKAIDLEGDMLIDNAYCKLPMLGTSYRLENDSVHLRPGEIVINALLMDEDFVAKPENKKAKVTSNKQLLAHNALLKGKLNHQHFKDLTFQFDVKANNLLGYNFTDFGEDSFYATAYASGDISIKGLPGRLTVDINATPEAGTVFTYNVSTPENITEAGFITFNDGNARKNQKQNLSTQGNPSSAKEENTNQADDDDDMEPSSDLFLNFNLQITPSVKMRLLMDSKSGDMIELQGNGKIMAKYHDKGRFNIYGTYRVQDGSYKLSIQDIIRRDFKFQPDGTIVFGGDPMKADLNMKAIYTVHGVSLDDLTTSSLGFSKTRVDCIMDLTGHPEQPAITFDFDLPDATEDEQQMVRSIVSTEEERNIQTIYLLGLGRFFNFDAQDDSQSTAAINSLVSSTLSQQINQFISNAVGNKSNWNFGTSLKTSDDGWRNMDVEGQLSGKLLNNRLLVYGNFGYREKYYTQRSFISDVSVEYLLTKNGTISIKAYNQANDRYFVQSSINSQGIGIQFKKDFNHIPDLFRWLMPRKKMEE